MNFLDAGRLLNADDWRFVVMLYLTTKRGVNMKNLNVYVVRHGQTYFNRYNKLQGWSNSPLTESGLNDARVAGKKLADIPFKAAYSSDTTRAQDTAKVILSLNRTSEVPLMAIMNFREEFYGSYEGSNMDVAWLNAGAPVGLTTYAAIVDEYGVDKTKDLLKAADPWHDAENADEFWLRVNAGFKQILENEDLQDGDNVLLISHGNTLISLADKFGGGRIQVHERPANGSVGRFVLSENNLLWQAYNDQRLE
jgi:probable phosphoglycerate mutase